MKDIVVVDGLDFEITQTITGISISNAHNVSRTAEGIDWLGSVTLMAGNAPLGNRKIRKAIADNSSSTYVELDVASQSAFGKNFLDLTVAESQPIQGQVMAGKMITAINESGVGLTIADVNALVMTIVTAVG